VLPLYHTGMGDVQPKGSTVPRVGRRLTVTVGEPLDLRDITCRCNAAGEDQRQVCWQSLPQGRFDAACRLRTGDGPNRGNAESVPGHCTHERCKCRPVLRLVLLLLPPRTFIRGFCVFLAGMLTCD
jgi:hypothetical protein